MTAPLALPDPHLLDFLQGEYGPSGPGEPFRVMRRGTFLHVTGSRHGLAMPWEDGRRLVVVWGPPAKTEIGAYLKRGDRITGLWVPPGAAGDDLGGCGVEESEVHGQVWKITRAVSIDGSAYFGEVRRTPFAGPLDGLTPIELVWVLGDGEFRSFGLEADAAVYSTFCFEDAPHALAVYDLDTLAGVVVDCDRAVRREVLRRRA